MDPIFGKGQERGEKGIIGKGASGCKRKKKKRDSEGSAKRLSSA
jgi:hypothetical protein